MVPRVHPRAFVRSHVDLEISPTPRVHCSLVPEIVLLPFHPLDALARMLGSEKPSQLELSWTTKETCSDEMQMIPTPGVLHPCRKKRPEVL